MAVGLLVATAISILLFAASNSKDGMPSESKTFLEMQRGVEGDALGPSPELPTPPPVSSSVALGDPGEALKFFVFIQSLASVRGVDPGRREELMREARTSYRTLLENEKRLSRAELHKELLRQLPIGAAPATDLAAAEGIAREVFALERR